MISTLELRQFRGLEHVLFENLGRANLLLGGNNSGKTSVLEALTLKFGSEKQIQKLPSTFRQEVEQDNGPNFWDLLAKDRAWDGFRIGCDNTSLETQELNPGIELVDSDNPASRQSILRMQNHQVRVGRVPTRLPTSILSTRQGSPAAISELFNQIAPLKPENEDRLQDLLREAIEPRLKRLRYAKPKGTTQHLVYADLGEGEMLPFTQLGQAFARTLHAYCEIFANQPKHLLIDEIENGLYYDGLEDYWKGLLAVLEDQDVQLFATTHSRECMEAAHRATRRANDEDSDLLRYLRLDRRVDDPGTITGTTFTGTEMQTAIVSNLEMR